MILRPKPHPPNPLEKLLRQAPFRGIPGAVVQHAEAVPLGVMVRGLLEWLLDEPALELLFDQLAPDHYTRELTITALVGLLIQVSVGAYGSVHAAYKAAQAPNDPTLTAPPAAPVGKPGR